MVPEFLRASPLLLTIDDGPSDAAADLKMLDVLNKHHAKAIWFVVCRHLDPALDPAASEHRRFLKLAVAAGHRIGNHTYRHVNLIKAERTSPSSLTGEVQGCSRMIESITGTRPKYFRPPWGAITENVYRLVRSEGMQTVYWSSDSHDWMAAFRNNPHMFMNYARNSPIPGNGSFPPRGGILLIHDSASEAEVLDERLSDLEAKGFVFVVPE